MKKEDIILGIIVIVIVATFFVGASMFVKSVEKSTQQRQETANQEYITCKEKTSDIEWCVKILKPSL